MEYFDATWSSANTFFFAIDSPLEVLYKDTGASAKKQEREKGILFYHFILFFVLQRQPPPVWLYPQFPGFPLLTSGLNMCVSYRLAFLLRIETQALFKGL